MSDLPIDPNTIIGPRPALWLSARSPARIEAVSGICLVLLTAPGAQPKLLSYPCTHVVIRAPGAEDMPLHGYGHN